MSTGDGRLQAELPGFVMVSSRKRPSCYTLYDLVMVCLVMVSWGHVLVAHTLHNVASLPRLCILHTWQREPLVPADTPLQNKRCLSRGAPFMIYHAASRAHRSIHLTLTTTASRARKSKVPRSEGAEPRTCSHFSDDSGLDMAGLIHSCVQRIASICHG